MASCQVGFKRRGEQLPTDFVDVIFNDSIGKLHVTGSKFIEYCIKEQEQYEKQPPEKLSAFQEMIVAALVKKLLREVSEKNSFDTLYNQS